MIPPRRNLPATRCVPKWHQGFLALLPGIRKHAATTFRQLKGEAREEAIQEVLTHAVVVYARLAALGKADLAYASVLVRYAVAQIHDGRRVGTKLNPHDVLSERARRRHGFAVEPLRLRQV